MRLAVVGLHRVLQRQPVPPRAHDILVFWQAAERQGMTLCITAASANLLRQRQQYAARFVVAATMELGPGRYCRRSARRLRETTGLSAEDTMSLALGTFGTDVNGIILGAHAVVTCDQALVNGYHLHLPKLRRRLSAMKAQLPSPFNRVALPSVSLPNDFQNSLVEQTVVR